MSSAISEKFPKDLVLLMNEVKNKLHRWRLCSKGFYYRGGTTQQLGNPKKNEVSITLPPTIWKCVRSSTDKDLLHSEEIIIVSGVYFPYLSGAPKPDSLDFPKGN